MIYDRTMGCKKCSNIYMELCVKQAGVLGTSHKNLSSRIEILYTF